MAPTASKTLLYSTSPDGKVAYITLNRPEHFNAINHDLPYELRAAVKAANADSQVHCIVLSGAGPGFCGGYDLNIFAVEATRGGTQGSQDVTKGYDPFLDFASTWELTECYTELFHSPKPTIAQVHGAAVAGGSDIALCCDLVIMAEDARIGYPPARVWGCPSTAMWAYRVGVEQAKRMLFTGDLIDGREAEAMGLVLKAVPQAELEETVGLLVERIKTVPINQLWMQKRVLNGTIEQGLQASQQLATIFDGMTRNSPEGIAFQQLAAQKSTFRAAIRTRDEPGKSEQYRKRFKSAL